MPLRSGFDAAFFNAFGHEYLPGHLGVVIDALSEGTIRGSLPIVQRLMAPNGFLHAGSVVTLADTLAGYACVAHLPEGASGFTTIELKTNFLGTAREGALACEAHAVHLGGTTHIWDATVWRADDHRKPIALFRCTQLVLYPKKA
jgi:1,4-dihydroxy-2-naphthoyl-CoA hydrolase